MAFASCALLVTLAMCGSIFAAGPALPLASQPVRGGLEEFSAAPSGPGWLALPGVQVRVVAPAAAKGVQVWVSPAPAGEWQKLSLSDGQGSLPFRVPTLADLWAVRFRVESETPVQLSLWPSEPIVVAPYEGGRQDQPVYSVTNWGQGSFFRARAVDASGAAVVVEPLQASRQCSTAGGWTDLGFVQAEDQGSFRLDLDGSVNLPVTLEIRDDQGHTATQTVTSNRTEAAPAGQVNYYGLTPLHNWDCNGNLQNNVTRMLITAISAPVSYTVYNLTDGTTFATGTITSKGGQASITGMTDNKAWKLATSAPVQAYMGYDCSGTLPGSMFFLADDGMLNYGLSFTVPLADFSDHRLQYWVFATGAGTARVKDLSGNTVATNVFSAAGAWMIPYANIATNTVYAITFSPSAPGAVIAIQQSSQNAGTDVPATSQVASACTVTNVGQEFYVDIQQWTGDANVAVFPYGGTGANANSYTVTPLTAGGTSAFTVTKLTKGTLDLSKNLNTGAYRITSTVPIGLIAGSPEGGTNVYDIGDDAYYYHGDGADIRGAAMRCGGAIFVAQDGTNITGTCTPINSSCGLPPISNPYSADSVLTISGDTSNTRLFDLKTQDSQHTLLVEVFGGNCSTMLNDWSKIMQPAAVGRPPIVYPAAGSPLLSTTPAVVGTAIPGATIQVYISPVPPGASGTQVLLGQAIADASGAWSLPYPTGTFNALTPGTTYNFDAVQFLAGACSAVPVPPVGSSGSSGVINVNAPTVVTPANGSTATTLTPALSGTAPATTTVTLTITGPGGPYTVTTTADGSGSYSVASPTLQYGGTFTVSAVAMDGAGNTSPTSNANTFTCVYPAPTVSSPINAGASSISGTCAAPAGTTITVYSNGVSIGTAQVQSGGAWTLTGVTGLAGGESITAKAGAGTAAESAVSNTVVVTPAPPIVSSPINAGDGSISGTTSAPAGSTIQVYKNGVPFGSAITTTGSTWTLSGVSGLVGGESVTAAVTAGGQTSGLSNTVVVIPAPPVITTPLLPGQTAVSGTSTAPAGSTVTVVIGGNVYTTSVQAGGAWSVGVPALLSGDSVSATVTAGGQTSAAATATVLAPATPPIVTASLLAGSPQTIYGSSVEAAGSTITVYKNGASVGTTTVNADGSWSLPGVALAAGDQVKATVLAPGKAVSGFGNTVVVASGSSSVTPPPVITPGIAAGATSVSGTFPTATSGVAIDLYADGVYLGTVTTNASGAWALAGLPALANGAILTATATQSGSGTSDWSAPVIVGTMLMLLRSDAMTSLTQNRAPLFTHAVATPPYPSLETLGPNHVFNQTEGPSPQPSAPGTLDDDKAYIRDIHSLDVDTDPTVLSDNGRPLVFYELLDNNTKTLKLSKTVDGKIQFTITP